MPYEYLDDIAISDVAFRAWSDTLDGLFVSAANATLNVMVDDIDSIEKRVHRNLRVEAESMEMLLFELLQELIFLKDAEQLLLRISDVEISEQENAFVLSCEAKGEEADAARHSLLVDVKAVTLHRFELVRKSNGWETTVVLDV